MRDTAHIHLKIEALYRRAREMPGQTWLRGGRRGNLELLSDTIGARIVIERGHARGASGEAATAKWVGPIDAAS